MLQAKCSQSMREDQITSVIRLAIVVEVLVIKVKVQQEVQKVRMAVDRKVVQVYQTVDVWDVRGIHVDNRDDRQQELWFFTHKLSINFST